jgi:DNA-binding CsgD family transcriptional regulator
LIQEAIYSQISGIRRRALHRHAARVLVEAGRYGAAASHITQAAEPGDDEAIETLCEALRRAEAGEHHREALTLLEALLTIVPPADSRWRKVVDVMPLTPEWIVDHRADVASEVGLRAMRRADQVLERSADLPHRAAVKFGLGSLLVWGIADLAPGKELLESARDLFYEAGDQHSALLATNEIGYHLGIGDDVAGHERTAREVLEKAEALGDDFLRLQALCSLAWALAPAGRIEEVLPVIEQAMQVAIETGRIYRRCYMLAMRGWIRWLHGDSRGPADIDLARELNPAYRDTVLLDFTAEVARSAGDLLLAVAAARDQMAWDGGVSPRRTLGASAAVMALAEMGRAEEATEIQTALDRSFGGHRWWSHSRLGDWSRAMVSTLSDGSRAGLEPLVAAVEDATSAGYWLWARWMVADLAESSVHARDGALAKRAHELLFADPAPPEGAPNDGLRAFVAGATATASGETETGSAALGAAVGHFEAAGWRLFEGRALALLGECSARSDPARAADALERAVACFDKCQATIRRQRAVDALSALGSKGRRKKADLVGPGALSGREREVARLAAEGLSAREIAERLYIGERTVETHLANAYIKLGVSSKLDLVRRASELGI